MIEAGFTRLAAALRSRPEPPHTTCTIPVDLFTGTVPVGGAERRSDRERRVAGDPGICDDHETVRLCRLFLLRRGARMAAPERHRNSVQRLVSYRGSGCIHQGEPVAGPLGLQPRAICSPPASAPGRDSVSIAADLDRYWDIVAPGVWHFPEAAEDEDWATVTFHSAAEDEIEDELWLGDESG